MSVWKPRDDYWWGWRVLRYFVATVVGCMIGLLASVVLLRIYGLPDTPEDVLIFAAAVSGCVGLVGMIGLELIIKEGARTSQ